MRERTQVKPSPPTGIKYKAWNKKTGRSEHTSKYRAAKHRVCCPNAECEFRSHSDPEKKMGFGTAGDKPPKRCPNGHPLDHRGYV